MKGATIVLLIMLMLLLSTLVVGIQILFKTTKPYVSEKITDCRPVCLNQSSFAEGWHYSCNQSFIKYAKCKYCDLLCSNAGNLFEGWYDSCTGLSIVRADCNKTIVKSIKPRIVYINPDRTTTTSTTTLVTTTTTTMPAECQPVCLRKTPRLKGWFNPCTDKLVRRAKCSHCRPLCLSNKKIEGWYGSCRGRFIMAADCG